MIGDRNESTWNAFGSAKSSNRECSQKHCPTGNDANHHNRIRDLSVTPREWGCHFISRKKREIWPFCLCYESKLACLVHGLNDWDATDVHEPISS